ncbi:hypothetical protein ACHAWC_004783, partial [Mediolabrus comicus]
MSSRGRASHYPEQQETSRGGSRDHLMDFNNGRNQYHDQRNAFSNEMRRRDDGNGYNHRSDTSYIDEHHAHAPHSQSWDPHSSRYSSSSQHDRYHYQERTYSSYHRKRSRSPHSNNYRNFYHDEGNRSKRHKSIGGGLPHDESHGRRPLGSTNGAEMQIQRATPHPMASNGPQQNDNSYSHRYNRVNNHNHTQYHHHYHSMNASHGRHGVSSRLSRPPYSQVQVRVQSPQFNKIDNIPELIQTACSSLSAMSSSDTAAFWSSMVKQLGRNNQLNLYYEQMDSQINQLFEHTQQPLEMFGPKDLSQTIYSIAKIVALLRKSGSPGYFRKDSIASSLSNRLLNDGGRIREDLFLSLANASVRNLSQSDAYGLSNLAYAYALIKYVPKFDDGSDLFDHIAMQSIKMRAEFNAQDVSNMVWAFATVDKRHCALFKAMGDQVVARRHLREFKPQELSNIVWAYATAGVNHPQLFEKMTNHIVGLDHLREFRPQALSNTVWAYATAGVNHPQLFEKMANHVVQLGHLRDFRPQALSNIVWAYATAEVSHPKLFEKVAEVATQRKEELNSQALSNIVWAYATAGVNHPQLFEKMANHVVQLGHLRDFKPQALSNIVWSYAAAGASHPELFDKVGNHIVRLDHLRDFKPQELSNTVWAYATAGISHPDLFEKIANHIVRPEVYNQFNPQDLSNTVWAYARAEVSHPGLFEKMANHVVKLDHLRDFRPQNLSNTVWAYATAQVFHPALFDKMASHIVQLDHLEEFIPQALSNIVWAYATAQVSHSTLFQKIADYIAGLDHLKDFKRHELYSTLWAYATEEVSHRELFDKIVIHIAGLGHLGLNLELLSDTMFEHVEANVSHPEYLNELDHLREFDTQNLEDAPCSMTRVLSSLSSVEDHPSPTYETNEILTLYVANVSGISEDDISLLFQIRLGILTVLVTSPKTSLHYKHVYIMSKDRAKALSGDGIEYWDPKTDLTRKIEIMEAINQQNIPSILSRPNVCGFNSHGSCEQDYFTGGVNCCQFGCHENPYSNVHAEAEAEADRLAVVRSEVVVIDTTGSSSSGIVSSNIEEKRPNSGVRSIQPSVTLTKAKAAKSTQPSNTSNVPPQTTTELSAPVQPRRLPVVRPSPAFFKRKPRVLASAIFMLRIYLRRTVEEVNKRVGRDLTLEMIEAQNKIITATINYVTERYDMILTQLDANGCFPLMRYDDIHNKRLSKFIYSISNSRHIEKTKSGMSAGADCRPIDQIPEGTNPNDCVGIFGKIDQ